MPKKGRRSGQDDALGADPGGLGGDEDYDWIRYLGEGSSSRSTASAGSSPAAAAPTSAALQSPARTVAAPPARPAAAQSAVTQSPGARPAAPRPAAARPAAALPAGRRPEPPQPYEPQPYEPQAYQPEPYEPQAYQPEPYEPQAYQPEPYEPQSYEPGPSRRFGRRERAGRTSGGDRQDQSGRPVDGGGSGRGGTGRGGGTSRGGGTGPLPATDRAGRAGPGGGPDQRGGYGSGQPSRSPSGTGPRRAVKVRQGRTTDLLFNPAAEDYGQPLYPPGDAYGQPAADAGGTLASPPRTPDRQHDDRFTSPQRRLDTAEFAQPLYPALDSGSTTDARPRRSRPGADPLGDTDARGRTAPDDRRPARSRPALPGPDRADGTGPQRRIEDLRGPDPRTTGPRTTGPQRRIEDLRGPDPRTTGPQRRIEDVRGPDPRTTGPQRRVKELGGADPLTGPRRGERTGPQRPIEDLSGPDPRTTGPQRRVDDLGGADPLGGSRRGERTGPQRRVDGLSRPDPLTDSGIGVLWASEPPAAPAGVAPEAAITKTPARRTGTGAFDRPDFDIADPLAEPADLPGTAPRGKPAPKPRKGAKKAAPSKPKQVKSRPRAGRRKKATVLLGGLVIIVALAAVGYFKLMPRTSHTVSAPTALGSYVKQQANATAKSLRHRIMVAAAGDVKNVVAAVYEQKAGPGTSKGPQIVVFIGGNLTGNASASDLINAYMTRLHGAFTTMPGRLGGQAACAPGSNGGPSECAWADGDTFGVVVSATLSATGLADEMRHMRPLVEHVAR